MKKSFIGILVLVLALGMTVVSCKDTKTAKTASSANAVITINAGTKYQYVRGFGGMGDITWTHRWNIQDIDTMFNPDKLGLNIMRIMIHPLSGSQTHAQLLNSSYGNGVLVAAVKKVNEVGGYVLATPWSPPAAWKSNNSTNGSVKNTDGTNGYLLSNHYQDYANYLKDFCIEMNNRGAPIYAVSIQNEPNFSPDYDACVWTPENMRDFFKQVGRFTAGAPGYGGGTALSSVRTMTGETEHTLEMHRATMKDSAALANIDLFGRHLYGWRVYSRFQNMNGKEMWMTEMNINSGNSKTNDDRNFLNDSKWDYVWLFMNNVDLSIRMNHENAYIWWYSKRFYSMIGDGTEGTTSGAILPRGHGLSHYAKFAKETNRVDVTVTGTTGTGSAIVTTGNNANVNPVGNPTLTDLILHGGNNDWKAPYDQEPGSPYQRAVKITAFESPDGNSISLVMYTPTQRDGTGGIDMGTIKIQLPPGFVIGSATAMRSTSAAQSQPETVTIGEDMNSAYINLPASNILSVRFTK